VEGCGNGGGEGGGSGSRGVGVVGGGDNGCAIQ
jgi:hypothetical protein